jgi:hypothetical protein
MVLLGIARRSKKGIVIPKSFGLLDSRTRSRGTNSRMDHAQFIELCRFFSARHRSSACDSRCTVSEMDQNSIPAQSLPLEYCMANSTLRGDPFASSALGGRAAGQMIDNLRITKTANFYSLNRPLSNSAIDELFRRIRASQPSASQNLFLHRREPLQGATWSAISFLYDRPPSFLLEDASVVERVCGFVLLVEYRGHIAVFKSRLDIPAPFSKRYLGRVRADRIDVAIARGDAVFEKIRLRNMSVSKFVMRNKTLEADDLRNAVGPVGSSRYVPQGYTVRSGLDHYSTTPNTGRISQRSDRVDHATLMEYARAVIAELVDGAGAPAPFIRTFARAIDLGSIGATAQPTTFAVDVAGLANAIHEQGEIRFVRRQANDNYIALTKAEVDAVLGELNAIFTVRSEGKMRDIRAPENDARIGLMAINKSRIALRSLELALCADLEVETTEFALGQDPNRLSLRRYIDRENSFIVLFDDLTLAYVDGTLFRDEAMAGGGSNFLRYLRTDPLLAAVTDEKGTFSRAHTQFDEDSTFGVVVRSVADDDEVLVCDDLGDEWADFIGLSNASSPPRITFYHAKHGNLSLGAGPFHVSVSQAIKNLGRLGLPADALRGKIRRWRRRYTSGGGVVTAISRVSRGDADRLADEFASTRNAPDAIRRVFIVTSSLSRRAVEEAFSEISAGQTPDPYFVQLYWLLLSFFSACTEVGAHGYVVCRE